MKARNFLWLQFLGQLTSITGMNLLPWNSNFFPSNSIKKIWGWKSGASETWAVQNWINFLSSRTLSGWRSSSGTCRYFRQCCKQIFSLVLIESTNGTRWKFDACSISCTEDAFATSSDPLCKFTSFSDIRQWNPMSLHMKRLLLST